MTINEWLESRKIKFECLDDDVFDIEGFGKAKYVDFSKKKSIYREFDDGETKKIVLNMFETPDELIESGIDYVFLDFGGIYNYIKISDETLEMTPVANIGKVKLDKFDFDYVNLGVHTGMDILNGSGDLKNWVNRAKFLNHKHIGICDYNTLGSTFQLQKACDDEVNPIFGYSTKLGFSFTEVNDFDATTLDIKVYAKGQEGLASLLRIQKSVMVDTGFSPIENMPNGFIYWKDLKRFSNEIALVLGVNSMNFFKDNPLVLKDILESGLFDGDIYFQIDFNEYKANRIDMEALNSLKYYFDNFYKNKKIKPILISDSYYINDFENKNKFTLNIIRSKVSHKQSDQQWYKDIEELYDNMKDIIVSFDPIEVLKESAKNTIVVAEKCSARYCTTKNYMPQYDMTDEEKKKYKDPVTMFDALLEKGFLEKVPKGKEDIYRERLEMERYVIKSTNNVDYMLNQYDAVNWAENNDITVGAGRGSAGGCLILYLLDVTKVDPIRFGLLFERFLLPERAGLYPAKVTKIQEYVDDALDVVDIEFEDGRKITVDADSQFMIEGAERVIYADELKIGDDAHFDNINNVFDIK